MHRFLTAKEVEISLYKVRRIMKENGLYPKIQIKYEPYPNEKSEGRYSKNILKQDFNVDEPNKIWAGDITYTKTTLGWAYLAVVMDLFNREIIGYSISKSVDTELVRRALSNALTKKEKGETLFRSDRGCQYSSHSYSDMLKQNGIKASMSRGDAPTIIHVWNHFMDY